MATMSASQTPSWKLRGGTISVSNAAMAGGTAAKATGHSCRSPVQMAPRCQPPCTPATVAAYTWATQNTTPLVSSSAASTPGARRSLALTTTVAASTEPYTADV